MPEEETLETEVAGLTLLEREEQRYRTLLEQGIIEVSKTRCYDPKEIRGTIIWEAMKLCQPHKQRITPHIMPGIPLYVLCVDQGCLRKAILEVARRRRTNE